MKYSKIIWFDITNVPHVLFLKPISDYFAKYYSYVFTLRDFAETKAIFEKLYNHDYIIVGKHKGKHKINKIYGVLQRTYELSRVLNGYDIKISIGGDSSNLLSWLMSRYSITFDDNECAPNWRYSKFIDYAFWPIAVPQSILVKHGFDMKNLYQYNGYKEDIYISDYVPDNKYNHTIPYDNYILVRPENNQANYIDSNSESITRHLLKLLSKSGYNVIFLPRYKTDREYAFGVKNVFIPEQPINGLDACYYADTVLTGAGTLAREAACLGVPAVSFYAGKKLLAVDKKMIQDGWMYHSRDPEFIIRVDKP
jgi:uncharacterized protein